MIDQSCEHQKQIFIYDYNNVVLTWTVSETCQRIVNVAGIFLVGIGQDSNKLLTGLVNSQEAT